MGFEKGNKHGKGRPKGSKDKITRDVRSRVMAVWDELDKQGKSLEAEALEDPKWFYKEFAKPMLPKDVVVQGDEDSPIISEIIIKHVKPER